MNCHRLFTSLFVCFIIVAAIQPKTTLGQSRVTIESKDGKHTLLRNEEPYFIRGGGGQVHLPLLASVGGNSIRTWSTDGLDSLLDEAQRNQITVCVGFWLGHERHGFNYQDESAVRKQLQACLAAVERYKNHPAVLMWGIGNEMEGEGNNPAIWYAVDHIARECKRIDPNHPTITVISETIDHKLERIESYCPNIDIVGINSYGGIQSVAERYRKSKSTKPYVVTEFGPRGPWEIEKTEWNAPIEATSTAKSVEYREAYRSAVLSEPDACFGSYAFIWGNKQETTATWFGLLLPDGRRTGGVDVLTEYWTGKAPKNRCPQIDKLVMDQVRALKPGTKVRVRLEARDLDRDPIETQWVLRRDSLTIGTGGDAQPAEPEFGEFVIAEKDGATIVVPEDGGAYRIFAFVLDSHGGAAVGNIPFNVDAPRKIARAPKGTLPYVLYDDKLNETVFVPSGYMGNAKAIAMDGLNESKPHSGTACLRVEYQAGDSWGGVLWQSPPGDWQGGQPGGLDLTGASAIEFWARGESGGEVVSFVVGAIEGNGDYRDSSKSELRDVRLTKDWQKLRIDLGGKDLHRIKTIFGWTIAGQGRPTLFYLDDIAATK